VSRQSFRPNPSPGGLSERLVVRRVREVSPKRIPETEEPTEPQGPAPDPPHRPTRPRPRAAAPCRPGRGRPARSSPWQRNNLRAGRGRRRGGAPELLGRLPGHLDELLAGLDPNGVDALPLYHGEPLLPSASAVPGPLESTPRLERCLVAVLDEGEVGRCGRKGHSSRGMPISYPGLGGPSACRRHSAAKSRLTITCVARRVSRSSSRAVPLTDGEAPLFLSGRTRAPVGSLGPLL
jgi:hypothetical protein